MISSAAWVNAYSRWLESLLPLRVGGAESISDFFLWVGGENWYLTSKTSSRVLDGDGRVVLGAADLWDPGRYRGGLEGLVGLDVVGVTCYDVTPVTHPAPHHRRHE